MVNVQKRLNGASVKADFWHGEKIGYPEKKKLKIATFTEAPSMGLNQLCIGNVQKLFFMLCEAVCKWLDLFEISTRNFEATKAEKFQISSFKL